MSKIHYFFQGKMLRKLDKRSTYRVVLAMNTFNKSKKDFKNEKRYHLKAIGC